MYPMNSNNGWLYGSKFTKLTIGDNITKIGDYTFYDCSSLTSVIIGNSVTSIGSSAFSDCSGLTSVTIGNGVTSVGEWAFYKCSSLTAFYGKLVSSDNRCLIINGTLKAFAPAGLTEYTIPDSVTSIGYYAFRNCSKLTSITIPDSVTSIGEGAFGGCSGLTSITIPDSVTSIGNSVFSACNSLTSVYYKSKTPPNGLDRYCIEKIFVPANSRRKYIKEIDPYRLKRSNYNNCYHSYKDWKSWIIKTPKNK